MLFGNEEQKAPTPTCGVCGTELRPDLDFCVECGHSVEFAGAAGGDGPDEDDADAGTWPCPRCGVGLMRPLSYGHPQCEHCGFMERE